MANNTVKCYCAMFLQNRNFLVCHKFDSPLRYILFSCWGLFFPIQDLDKSRLHGQKSKLYLDFHEISIFLLISYVLRNLFANISFFKWHKDFLDPSQVSQNKTEFAKQGKKLNLMMPSLSKSRRRDARLHPYVAD